MVADGTESETYLKVPPFFGLKAWGVVVTGVVVSVVVAGTVVAGEVVTAEVVVVGGKVVVVVAAGVPDCPELQPTKINTVTNKTAIGINNFFNFSSIPNYLQIIEIPCQFNYLAKSGIINDCLENKPSNTFLNGFARLLYHIMSSF
jgi:hypothetical protein